jgi:2-methylcitrate dehydratase
VTPEQFTEARILDPTIRAQLAKVQVVADPEIERLFPQLQRVHVLIATKDGRELERRLDYPKGDPRNPMTDAELDEKFDALAAPVCSAAQAARMKDAIRAAETFERATELMGLLAADNYKVRCR